MSMIKVHDKHFAPYLSRQELDSIVHRLAGEIERDYRDRQPLLCPVLTGSFIFAADLVRAMESDPEVAFVRYTSYSGMSSTGKVRAELPFPDKCRGRHVVVVEDIVETGTAMEAMLEELRQLEPASIAICTLLTKPDRFHKPFRIDYVGKAIANDFIVGYGLDYDDCGRTYKEVYILDDTLQDK